MTAKCLWTYSHSTQEKRNGGGVDLGERGGRGMEVGERENAAVMHCNTEE